MKSSLPINGIFPIAPTPFTEKMELDKDGMRRVIDCMIDQEVDAICILANYSEQFSLSDIERDELLDISAEHLAGRVPLIVNCSHFSTYHAISRANRAAVAGAQMLMVMPPYHGATLHADEEEIYEHFARIAEAAKIPIIVQDAPISGVTLSVDLLARMAKAMPLVRYFKIETPGTANKLRSLIAAGGESIVGPFDGEESITLMADLDAGAQATMSSALLPDLIRPIVMLYHSGQRLAAAEAYKRILPLINYENRQCGLRATKVAMKDGGVIRSDTVRHPLKELHPSTRAGLMELVHELQPMVLCWGK